MIPISARYDCDFAIVGGGIGGLMAGIAAKDAGAERVIIFEKCHALRSGSGAMGNDHFRCWLEEEHGPLEDLVRQTLASPIGQVRDPLLLRQSLEKSFDIVKMWDEWGIEMRPTGKYEFMGHAFPGKPRPTLKYNGTKQKKVLTDQAKKRGVEILNHHPVLELFKQEGRIAGLLALDMTKEEPSFVLVRSKTVLLSTGHTSRLYITGPTPAYMFNTSHCPNNAGGQALGWRIGAKLVNMEIPYRHAGPKFFARSGKGTWIGVYRYPDGRPIGPFATKPDIYYGDITGDVWNTAFSDVLRDGSGPAYQDCSGATPEQLAFQRKAFFSEGLSAMVNYMDDKKLDPAENAFEFMPYEPTLHGRGIEINERAETSVPGLFAAGDMVGNGGAGIHPAAYFGMIGGQNAAADARNLDFLPLEENEQVQERMAFYSSFAERKVGPDWREANFALQQIMSDYAPAGPERVRTENILNAGIAYLEQMRQEMFETAIAPNSHTLMRLAEVIDLSDCGLAIMHAAKARQESRAYHRRADFRFTNPLLAEKQLNVFLENGEVKTEYRNKWK